MPLRFCIESGPGPWESAQRSSDANAVRAAVRRTIDLARVADEHGADSFWVPEDPDGWDGVAVLSTIAQHTSRIRLGTGVVNPYYRHPALIAASMSTVDVISGGRAFLGLGRGQTEWYERGLGMPIGRPVQRLSEAVGLLRQWWSEGEANASNADPEFPVAHWKRGLRSVQPSLPIYLAAVGPKAMELAATMADGVIFNDLSSTEFMRDQIGVIRRIRRERGLDDRPFAVVARCQATVTDNVEAVLNRAKATVAMIHALPHMERLLRVDGFDTERIIADVRTAMHTKDVLARGGAFSDLRASGDLDAAKRAIPDDLVSHLVVAGSLGHVRARLRELEDIGVTHAFLRSPGQSASLADFGDLIATLSHEP